MGNFCSKKKQKSTNVFIEVSGEKQYPLYFAKDKENEEELICCFQKITIIWPEDLKKYSKYSIERSSSLTSFTKQAPQELISYHLFLDGVKVDVPSELLKRMIYISKNPFMTYVCDCMRFVYYLFTGEFISITKPMNFEHEPADTIYLLDTIVFFDPNNCENFHMVVYIGNTKDDEPLFLGKIGVGGIGFSNLREISRYMNCQDKVWFKVSKIFVLNSTKFIDFNKTSVL